MGYSLGELATGAGHPNGLTAPLMEKIPESIGAMIEDAAGHKEVDLVFSTSAFTRRKYVGSAKLGRLLLSDLVLGECRIDPQDHGVTSKGTNTLSPNTSDFMIKQPRRVERPHGVASEKSAKLVLTVVVASVDQIGHVVNWFDLWDKLVDPTHYARRPGLGPLGIDRHGATHLDRSS